MSIYARTPVNGTAKKVINQCGCADVFEFNGIKEERDLLRKNITILMRKSNGGRLGGRDKAIVTEGNKRLAQLNKILAPYDEYRRQNRYHDYGTALQRAIKDVYGKTAFETLDRMAKELLSS